MLVWRQLAEHIEAQLRCHGWLLQCGGTRFTNERYACDILLFRTSLSEVSEMLSISRSELCKVGLDLHPDQTVSLSYHGAVPDVVDIGCVFAEVFSRHRQRTFLSDTSADRGCRAGTPTS